MAFPDDLHITPIPESTIEPPLRQVSRDELMRLALNSSGTMNTARIEGAATNRVVTTFELMRIGMRSFLTALSDRNYLVIDGNAADLAFKRAHPNADRGNFPVSAPTNTDPLPEQWDATPYQRVYAADVVVFTYINDIRHVLVVRRGDEPFKGRLALPGGLVEPDETGYEAAIRECVEETGIDPRSMGMDVRPIGVYDTPGRDPRGPQISMAYVTWVDAQRPIAGDDAADALWLPLRQRAEENEHLAFDHDRILVDALTLVNTTKFYPSSW